MTTKEINHGTTDTPSPAVCCRPWTRCTQWFHAQLQTMIQALSKTAAQYPMSTIGVLVTLSLALAITGLATNFSLEVDLQTLYSPHSSTAQTHNTAISTTMQFEPTRPFYVLVHAHGDNVLSKTPMQHVFQALEAIQTTPGYSSLCGDEQACRISSPTRYWHHNRSLFEQSVRNDRDFIQQLSHQLTETPEIDPDFFLGNYRYDHHNHTLLTFVESFLIRIEFPQIEGVSEALEARVLERLKTIKGKWGTQEVTMDFLTMYAYTLEFQRAIYKDLPLIVVVATIMSAFTMLYYRQPRSSKLPSRSLFLGLGSVGTVGLALFSGYGLLFLCGVPFTTLTQVLPFIVFGIGLDDCFIITGAYFRTSASRTPQQRIGDAMEEVGLSITVTTVTTVLAFGIGASSSIPGIRWLCLYAAPTILFVYLYSITVFVALIVLDERRIQDHRKDCCIWIKMEEEDDDGDIINNQNKEDAVVQQDAPCKICLTEEDSITAQEKNDDTNISDRGGTTTAALGPQEAALPIDSESTEDDSTTTAKEKNDDDNISDQESDIARQQDGTSTLKITADTNGGDCTEGRGSVDRFMAWYATFLMKPAVKICVLVAFAAYFAGCAYSTTLMTQDFKIEEFVPTGSYVASFLSSLETHFSHTRTIGVYFRNIDQGNETVQKDMVHFVEELARLPQISADIPLCWIRDLHQLKATGDDDDNKNPLVQLEDMGIVDFDQQVDIILSMPQAQEAYGPDIVRDDDGKIVASRCWVFLDHTVDLSSVKEQIQALHALRETTEEQKVNFGRSPSSWSYFTYDELYLFWSFYDIAVDELIFTTVSGVVAVTLIALFLIPHWTAVLFVLPTISFCYINLLGTLQYAGLHINAVTYVCLVISIGLLVDFLMHVLLRYYEEYGTTREEKIQKALRTMGSSILVGGVTTFLGVVPLAFSTTKIFQTVCIAFFAMVTLGLAHGLIFLPVVLSIVGPVANISLTHHYEASSPNRRDSLTGEDSLDEEGASSTFRRVSKDRSETVQEISKCQTDDTDVPGVDTDVWV